MNLHNVINANAPKWLTNADVSGRNGIYDASPIWLGWDHSTYYDLPIAHIQQPDGQTWIVFIMEYAEEDERQYWEENVANQALGNIRGWAFYSDHTRESMQSWQPYEEDENEYEEEPPDGEL